MPTPKPDRPYQLVVVLDPADRERLEESIVIEKLTRADVVRRALRDYHRRLRAQARVAS